MNRSAARYCHILLDGRDVPATSALEYVAQLEDLLPRAEHEGAYYAIASGGGRMQITMDRYEANWPMVEAGWRTHVPGLARQFASAKEAIETYRAEDGTASIRTCRLCRGAQRRDRGDHRQRRQRRAV